VPIILNGGFMIRKEQLSINISFYWKPIMSNQNEIYQFPDPITQYMRENYCIPIVYRFNVFKNTSGDQKIAYIGESRDFIKTRRLYFYIKPYKKQTTNIYLRDLIDSYIRNGYKVQLDHINLSDISGIISETKSILDNIHPRLFLEEFLITAYRRLDWTILNKD